MKARESRNIAPVFAYVGIGSNLGDSAWQVTTALEALALVPHTRLVKHSGLYRSDPLGGADQPGYINAVAALDTSLGATELLRELHAIEDRQGRVRGSERWESRTLDLDLLLYGDLVMETAALTVPHPGLTRRNFVLVPLFEITPELVLPDGQTLESLVRACGTQGLLPL